MQKPFPSDTRRSGQRLAWWQLLRIGNVFTAISNIVAGFLLVHRDWDSIEILVILVASSSFLYTAGMVLNDAFDAKLDAQERPERPIPSGRISRKLAFAVGFGLLALGIACTCLASWQIESKTPCIIGLLLAGAVVSYDALWKSTALGPSAMGVCRFLNVLLGASSASNLFHEPAAWFYAAVVGIYTIGLTLFARSENETSKSVGQVIAGVITVLAILLLGVVPYTLRPIDPYILLSSKWSLLIGSLAASAGLSYRDALKQSSPAAFRKHVSRLLLGFFFLDALACLAAAGWLAGLIVLTLILPTKLISRWAPMT